MARKFRIRLGGKKGPHSVMPRSALESARLFPERAAGNLRRLRGAMIPNFRLTPQGVVQMLRRFFGLLRATAVWGAYLALTVALILSMMTAQTPWNVVMGRPPLSGRTATALWYNDQQQYGVSQALSVADDGSLLAAILTATSGTMLRIDAQHNVTKSAQVLFKDYSLFIWADSRGSVWLHRGSKTLQKFDPSGEVLWQKQLDAWPETCWSSSDGYLLVAVQDGALNQNLVLISPRNQELWTYSLSNATVIDAAVAPEGKGVALAVLKLDSATPQAFGYLLDSTGRVSKVNSLGDGAPRQASISNDGTVAAIGNAFKVVVLKQAADKPILEIELKNELQSLKVGGKGGMVAVASAIDPGFIFENNKTALQVNSTEDASQLWNWQLSETLRGLAVADNEESILVTTAQRLQVFALDGEASWGLESKDLGAELRNVVVSPSSQIVGILDSKDRLSIWKAPHE